MTLTLCVLASGSSANSTYVATEDTRVLIDAGLSGKETVRRLAHVGADPAGIHAVCVTHEHQDHNVALGLLQRRFGVDLYANTGTVEAIESAGKRAGLEWQVFTTGVAFEIGSLTVEPFSVPHDSYDPVGFVLSSNESRVGIVTDMGMATGLIRERLRRCRAVVVEANHDEGMLRDAPRPWSLKQRIAGRQGHLSNAQAAELVESIAGPDLRYVFLAHLSSECNRPELAVQAVRQALDARGYGGVEVKVAHPDRPSDVVCV